MQIMNANLFRKFTYALVLILTTSIGLQAQYFGRNKPKYRKFDFKVVQSPHFEIYHYLKDKERVHEIGNWLEQWYDLHQRVFRDTFYKLNPVIIYNNHADFQQTTTISGSVSVGTGGVTEAFKNRVIFPIALTNQQTFHVIGHELIHAFQYNMVLNGDSTNIQNLANLPLWMVEGLAEYMSIGRVDAHTAMWMRDAVLQDDVPSIRDLSSGRYFPYRYGQVFWSFVTGIYGDQVIEPLFMATAKYGLKVASDSVLSVPIDTLSKAWQRTVKEWYQPYVGETEKNNTIGKSLVDAENGGQMNISPVLSPNGRYMIFLSEKELFTTDLYLADARSGEIIRKVASSSSAGHIDDLNYLESAGSWSPDGDEFVYVAFAKGKNSLVFADVESGKIKNTIHIDGLPAFSHPSWSPDGKSILLSGNRDGQTDLFLYKLRSGELVQLTDDRFAEIQGSWSPDGSQIIYATDETIDERRAF